MFFKLIIGAAIVALIVVVFIMLTRQPPYISGTLPYQPSKNMDGKSLFDSLEIISNDGKFLIVKPGDFCIGENELCKSFSTKDDAINYLTNIDDHPSNHIGMYCGDDMYEKTGTYGWESPNHWCRLSVRDSTKVCKTRASQVDAAISIPEWRLVNDKSWSDNPNSGYFNESQMAMCAGRGFCFDTSNGGPWCSAKIL